MSAVQNLSAKAALDTLMSVDGAVAAALCDKNSGMVLATAGSGLDLEVAAAGNADVLRAKERVARSLGFSDAIEDLLITLSTQYHIIRPVRSGPGLFLYLACSRDRANLAMARRKMQDIESMITI